MQLRQASTSITSRKDRTHDFPGLPGARAADYSRKSAHAIPEYADRVHWHTCTSTNLLSAWIALQDCDESMGPVVMIDGSHRWPDTEKVSAIRYNDTFFRGDDPAKADSMLESIGIPIRRVPLLLRKGQVSFHSCMTIHGSGSNLSDLPRVGLIVHMQDRANRYQRVHDETGKLHSHVNDQLCGRLANGDLDYSDPEICPVLWEETGA